MSVSNKIKGLLRLYGKQNTVLATHLGLSSVQALNMKFARGSFTVEDMIKIAIKDALSKVDKETEEKMGVYGQSLNGLM